MIGLVFFGVGLAWAVWPYATAVRLMVLGAALFLFEGVCRWLADR